MRYAEILENDVVNGENVCVSFFAQGCPHHCKGCFNPETWDFEGGKEAPAEAILTQILNAIDANGIQRNLSILGGEPLCEENLEISAIIINEVRRTFPDIKIYVWTGYTYEELLKKDDPRIKLIFSNIDYLIDGPFIQEKKDLTLKLRGSSNQRIFDMREVYRI